MRSIAVQDKARRIVDRRGVRDDPSPRIWWVTGQQGIERRVQLIIYRGEDYWTCSCQHGQYAGGRARCSHVVAVKIHRGDES